MLEIGSVIDKKYKILSIIGQGGMSTVYLAIVEKANKHWAIKEIRKDGVQNYEIVSQGLIGEIDMLKKLKHPNLPSIVDVIDKDGSFFIVMDYIEGITLKEALIRYGVPTQDTILDWAKQLCGVLGYLHSRTPPIIYRDVKPSNIMMQPDGKLILIDFGTAREFKNENVEDTVCLGTKGYAAPEQFGGQGQTDERTDIYSLGATLYHLITGHNPGKPPYEMYPVRHWNPSLSPGLENILLKCTQNNPDDRYQSCEELLYALEHYEEFSEAYRKIQKKKTAVFFSLIFCLSFFFCCFFCLLYRAFSLKTNHYKGYLEQAVISGDNQKKIQYIKKAISLDPGQEVAYLTLLDFFLQDELFSLDEDQLLSQILNSTSQKERESCLYRLKKNREGYREVAYEIGMAYWYYYEQESARKRMSVKWFQDVAALSGQGKEQAKYMRAVTFSRIGQYYDQLGRKNRAGDVTVTYKNYWEDLTLLIKEEIEKKDNQITALRLYEEISSAVCIRTKEFQDAGIREQQLEDMLDEIEEKVKQDQSDDSQAKELISKIRINIRLGRNKIQSTFHG